MTHKWNVASLLNSHGNIANDFLQLYLSLIAIEIGLKNHLVTSFSAGSFSGWSRGHSVNVLLTRITLPGNVRAVLNSEVAQLTRLLSELKVTGLNGSEHQLSLGCYPEIRYLRHDSDFTLNPPVNCNQKVSQALNITKSIILKLQTNGIM